MVSGAQGARISTDRMGEGLHRAGHVVGGQAGEAESVGCSPQTGEVAATFGELHGLAQQRHGTIGVIRA